MIQLISPNWPAPKHIHALTTTRIGGFSQTPYDSFNLGDHVGDDEQTVLKNRNLLREYLQLPNDPLWLEQVHDSHIINADDYKTNHIADGCYANKSHQVCVIMTADCLPILITNKTGSFVAALHGGWRSLAANIIEKSIALLQEHNDFLVWLGPAIGAKTFEVGDEVKEVFIKQNPKADTAFTPSSNQRWLMDIYTLAKLKFHDCGISDIYGGDYCTYADSTSFYSYRRDGQTGRMASLIWF